MNHAHDDNPSRGLADTRTKQDAADARIGAAAHGTPRPDSAAHGAQRETVLEPAGVARRVAAFGYDLLLLAAVLFIFTLALFPLTGGRAIEPGTLWYRACLVAIIVLFFAGFWVHGGQTLGMRAWRLRLVARDGGPVRWPSALVRFAAGLVSLAPAGLGLWWALIDPNRRAWHDRLSRTRVVHERARVSASARTTPR